MRSACHHCACRSWKNNTGNLSNLGHAHFFQVDQLLRQSGAAQMEQNERVMDSNDLERERGITILSKSTSVPYKGNRINIVDTPGKSRCALTRSGHADFGGEVERVLSMVDGVCLVICATEGPMTQTKFVLTKALQRNLKPLVVMNKVDRPTARPEEVENGKILVTDFCLELLELFISLDATDEQLDYPIIYASAKDGWATTELGQKNDDIYPLLDKIVEHVPPPLVDRSTPFSMLVTVASRQNNSLDSKLKMIHMLENVTLERSNLERSNQVTRSNL